MNLQRRADFEIIYDQHSPALFGLIQNCVKDLPLAETILQEVFMSVWNDSVEDLRSIRLNKLAGITMKKLCSINETNKTAFVDYYRSTRIAASDVPKVEMSA